MTTPTFIPFNRPCLAGRELAYLEDAVRGGHASGDGPYTKKCQTLLEQALGVRRVLLTTSCTHALEMAALLLDIHPGDEVILPTFTFVSTANAFVLRGAKPVFVDIRPDTLNIDERLLQARITARTRAIVPVHYAGVACAMDEIMAIAAAHGISVVEDNAHGLFGMYRGRALGTFGALATQSFHETKNINCGEGGALVINDSTYIARAEVIREKGTNRSRFFRGEVDKYTWTDIGSSYVLSDLLAAYLLGQLEAREAIQAKRIHLWRRYAVRLTEWARQFGIGLPHVPPECGHAAHLFYLLMPTAEARTAVIAHLKARSIYAVFHYLPLHTSEMGARYGGKVGDCPVAEDVAERLVRLPFYNDFTDDEFELVISALCEFVPAGRP